MRQRLRRQAVIRRAQHRHRRDRLGLAFEWHEVKGGQQIRRALHHDEPRTGARPFEEVVAETEKATALVLVY